MAQSPQEAGKNTEDIQFWISFGVALLGTIATCALQGVEAAPLVSGGIAALAYANMIRLELTHQAPKI